MQPCPCSQGTEPFPQTVRLGTTTASTQQPSAVNHTYFFGLTGKSTLFSVLQNFGSEVTVQKKEAGKWLLWGVFVRPMSVLALDHGSWVPFVTNLGLGINVLKNDLRWKRTQPITEWRVSMVTDGS